MMAVTVLRNGIQVYAREQAFGGNQLTVDVARLFGMSVEEAETAKRGNALPENYTTDLLRPFM
ncbi:pilus assembly protein PilM, partial [Salmonella enterica]|uniref:pilus assembly protein PilM n=1 Tax=Salmonella enterica TaxID=28901 RepID=UPI003CE87731